jgi:predicted DNA-binding WGR domain protein
MSELGRRAVVNKASVDMGNQIGRLSQDTMNANIKGKSEHDRLTTETGLQNERERISTETAKSQKKLDDYSAMSGWVGNLGKVVGSEFADAQKEDMQLVSIVAGSPVGRTMRKIGSSYYNIDKVGSGLSVVSPVIGGKGQKTRYFHNDDEIDEETYNTLEAADRKKGTVPHVAN